MLFRRCSLISFLISHSADMEQINAELETEAELDGEVKCSICEKVCSSTQSLSRHKKIHSNELTKQCTICMKDVGCERKDNYKRHVKSCMKKRAASVEKPQTFDCEPCNKSFSTKQHIVRRKRRKQRR